MKLKVILDKHAQMELDDAAEYYELKVSGLGKRFKDDVKQAVR